MYHSARRPHGIAARNRDLLERLHRGTSGPFTPATASALLGLDIPKARLLLAYLTSRKWLARIRRGLYTVVPLGATSPAEWREDPWVVATSTFAPCYVGGWSAAEHWGLTEQIFRDVVIVTGCPIRKRLVRIQDTTFHLKPLPPAKHFGVRPVWRGRNRVQVSDPSRTVVDMLDDPRIGGGIRHITDMLNTYFAGEHRDDHRILEYAVKLGNRTVFKRLGFLLERLGVQVPQLLHECRKRRSVGLSLLDPIVPGRGKIVKGWNLRVNVGELSRSRND